MSRLGTYLALRLQADQALHEAQARSMATMLKAWDEEIKRGFEALLDAQKKRHLAAQADAALSSSLAVFIRGLAEQAKGGGGDDITCSKPTSLGVDGLIGDTSVSELISMLGEVDGNDDEVFLAQRQAAGALAKNQVPHPASIAGIFDALADLAGGRSDSRSTFAEWGAHFRDQGQRLATIGDFRNPQLQAVNGAARLEIARETVQGLQTFSPGNTVRLIAAPASLLDSRGRIPAPRSEPAPARTFDLHGLLNTLFVSPEPAKARR